MTEASQEIENRYTAISSLFWNKPAEQVSHQERDTVKKGLWLLSYRGDPEHAKMMTRESAKRLLECFETVAYGAVLPKTWHCPDCGKMQPIEVCLYSIKHFDPSDGSVSYTDLESDAIICTGCYASLDDYIPKEQRDALYKAADSAT